MGERSRMFGGGGGWVGDVVDVDVGVCVCVDSVVVGGSC